jgi:signal transduction histidine kinase
VDQATVLIISDDAEFSREITSRWQSERSVPSFTLMSSDIRLAFDPENFQLAIAGRIRTQALSVVLEAMDAAGKRLIFVSENLSTMQTVHDRWPRILALRQQEGWLDTLMLLASESLFRARAEVRAHRAEHATATAESHATLGRYMLEMRHTFNDALTSVLGNSELLLLEAGSLSAEARSQLATIRNMSLRMHEILQRFSSLEKELCIVERQAERETKADYSVAAGAR